MGWRVEPEIYIRGDSYADVDAFMDRVREAAADAGGVVARVGYGLDPYADQHMAMHARTARIYPCTHGRTSGCEVCDRADGERNRTAAS